APIGGQVHTTKYKSMTIPESAGVTSVFRAHTALYAVLRRPTAAQLLRTSPIAPGLLVPASQAAPRAGEPAAARAGRRGAAARHHPASLVQRGDGGEPASRCGRANGLPARAARSAGLGRLDRRDARARPRARRTVARARA